MVSDQALGHQCNAHHKLFFLTLEESPLYCQNNTDL